MSTKADWSSTSLTSLSNLKEKTVIISTAFSSKYVKVADLKGKQVKAVVSHVTMETFGNDELPVLYFNGKEKGIVLNKTNAKTRLRLRR